MSRLDLLVFGATGFSGKIVVENIIRICRDPQYSDLTWGLAGRSLEKLQAVLQELKDADTDLSSIPLLEADVSDPGSLLAAAGRTRVLLNCTGPYTLLGAPVVRACIAARTHYVDITAELHFMLQTYRSFDSAAREAGVLVVPACGFGSVPAALGLLHLEHEFQGTLHSAHCYTALDIAKRLLLPGPGKTLVHYGTWASLVHELKNYREYSRLKRETFPEDVYEPALEPKRSFFHKHKGKCWFPYPGPDQDVIEMSQRHLHEHRKKPAVRCSIYTTMPAFYHLLLLIPAFMFYYHMSFLACFRYLLMKYPRLFTLGYMSHKGPSKRNRNDTKFSFVFTGKGWTEKPKADENKKVEPFNKTVCVKVSGVDAYATTAVAMVLSAITVLKDQDKMPKGGVVPLGAAFFDTSLVERLNHYGLKFEVVDEESIKF
ncbi:hypothetical protein JYU34_009150 [Plutella xylostella]|uniref:Saccharopine dehydrogenase NADP binding domain-containing protein n=1 Tax=Plutella xylostella TaxID=51655 RepID=A0ABQ7QN96_PLUXY|nr:hypothetical protein JYU34_009150 [Plutella xylostella]